MAEQEAENIIIPVRRWIRGHYTKLTSSNVARCNHCNVQIFIHKNKSLAILHKHLVKRHSDKLNEEQKKEDKFHWIWDYFIAESDIEATCKECNLTIKYQSVSCLKKHLKRIHKILGPNSDHIDNESNSDNNLIANEDLTPKTDNFIPVRLYIRKHYTKFIRNKMAKCNYCNAKFTIRNKSLNYLHKHLVKAHPDKLNEEQKKEDKFYWTWDYFIAKSDIEATCKECNLTIKYQSVSCLKKHLKRIHKILGPNSDRVDNESNSDN
ncbi:PREDICTED: uncharacterized protein LOC105625246, partial [Atta cephalotes]|uniref:C2H2-type domain-containing protein n=1 Tax=Atta cephalotes TaxID=12957 RepID=A0A158NWR9_ATTCE